MARGRDEAGGEAEPEGTRSPGCGLAAYGFLLLFLCGLGVLGMTLSAWNLFAASRQQNPFRLLSGAEVDAWRLEPMRAAGLLGPQELPLAWHDESPDMSGSVACALSAEAVLRLESGQARRLAWRDIASVDLLRGGGGEVITIDAREGEGIGCRFRPEEGANRFLRMVQVELLRRERGG